MEALVIIGLGLLYYLSMRAIQRFYEEAIHENAEATRDRIAGAGDTTVNPSSPDCL